MSATDEKAKASPVRAKLLLIFALMVIAIVAGMIWSLNYQWPSGKPLGFWEFLVFWSRELLFLFLAAIGLVTTFVRGKNK